MTMRKTFAISFIFLLLSSTISNAAPKIPTPWSNGKLSVSDEGRYLKHENGKPFFWLGETGWLLPQRLNRDEVAFYLDKCQENGYNVVQVQTLNGVPSMNVYGQLSMIDGYDFSNIDKKGVYGYWDHMDYIIEMAASRGIYIGMVCIWGGPVKQGKMNVEEAKAYGKFLGSRYKNHPNIIWFIGGDIQGDLNVDEWVTLAESIKAEDKNHIMTFHPRGRTTSAIWFNDAHWLDFNMFQSGHRRYGQRKGDKNYPIEDNTEEDNWRYVDASMAKSPLKPVVDGEPIYEDIPQGLHDPNEPRWIDNDVRRYAYWSVFAGSFGHTYGHNSIMQMLKPGYSPAYGATKPWYEAINDAGFTQMKHLKNLMLSFPYFERIPDQSVIVNNGDRYDRVIATRGKNYLLAYNYSGKTMQIDLRKISGSKKYVWRYNPRNGDLRYLGEFDSKIVSIECDCGYMSGNDYVLIAVDSSSSSNYIQKDQTKLADLY